MKCCITRKKSEKKIKNRVKIGVALILFGVIVFLIITDSYVKAVVQGYPLNVASGVMRQMMDRAMDNVLKRSDINPSTVDKILYDEQGEVVSIKTNTTGLTKIKTAFTTELGRLLNDYGDIMTVKVPIGTLIGNEYTLGRGPSVSFKLQYSCSVETNLKSNFYEAGINNTIHSIELVVINHINVVIPWGHSGRDISTKYIVAESVIVGAVPDAFTNIHGADEEITDDVIDFGAKAQ